MKVVWNTCKRELDGIKSVSTMKTATKSSLKTAKANSLWEI